MKTYRKVVTPGDAAALLERNHGNRSVRPRLVERLADDIASGRWHLTHQGIALAGSWSRGQLVDGQHRLHAIVKANRPAELLVTEYADAEVPSHAVWDDGAKRSVRDAMAFRGVEHFTHLKAAIARGLMFGSANSSNPPSKSVLVDFAMKHAAAVDFASSMRRGTTHGTVLNAPALAAFARAYYWVDQELLARCSKILNRGFPDDEPRPGDKTVMLAWARLVRGKAGPGHEGSRIEQYCTVAKAIWHAERGDDLKQLKFVRDDFYPLPDDADLPIR